MKNYSRRMIMTCFLVFCSLFFLSVPQRVRGDDNVQELRLVAGNKWAKDEDAFVFVILGDGFTEAEQEFFFEKAEKTAGYILETSPFKEHQEIFKLYALGCISGESGARGDKAQSKQEEIEDSRDTLFHSRFWTEGVQRLLSIDESEEKKALLMAKQYVPQVDYAVVLVNSETYGGSGGQVCVTSLHEQSLEIVLHELGHTIAGMGDEYWPGIAQMTETPNTTSQSDSALVPWADLVGQDGIDVYPYEDGEPGWYKPSINCKMQYLGKEYPFCAVCSRELEKAFLMHSNPEKVKNGASVLKYILIPLAFVIVVVFFLLYFRYKKRKSSSIDKLF